MSRFFMNDRASIVSDAIEGTIISSPFRNLVRLEVDAFVRVVMRSDWDKQQVAIISGGGSGHEPAHVGFVGKGMLTAAVCGDIFASPSVDAVLNAIVAVTGEAGCLLIVKNYTGDRLNFGLAAEKAKAMGYSVELVMVSDDISLPGNKQPRGIAGTAFVHKIAGWAAAQGYPLSQVTDIARQAISNTASIGVAMQACHLPGDEGEGRAIETGHVELGLGIHGEPGSTVLDTDNSRQIMDIMVGKLLSHLPEQGELAVLVNNLGGVSPLEMSLLTRELAHSTLSSRLAYLIGPAPLVSALDMKGFSLSALVLDEELQAALLSPVETAGWQAAVPFLPMPTQPADKLKHRLQVSPSDNKSVGQAVGTVTRTLIDLETELNRLDALVGDGDTGTTFAAGAQEIARQLEEGQLPLDQLDNLFSLVGEQLATVMGGSSGVLMSILFTAAGQQVSEGQSTARALLGGLSQMKHYGGADLGDRTLIDALQPALEALDQGGNLKAAADAARQGAESTARMSEANAGRSSYLNSDSLSGNKDPGALAVEKVFEQLALLAG